MKFSKSMKSVLVLSALCGLMLAACGGVDKVDTTGTGFTGGVDPSESAAVSTVTLTKWNSSDGSAVAMSVGVFGTSTDDLTDATIDISINGTADIAGVDAAKYYNESTAYVEFNVVHAEVGDTITFDVTRSTGAVLTYTGTVSSDADTEAALEASN